MLKLFIEGSLISAKALFCLRALFQPGNLWVLVPRRASNHRDVPNSGASTLISAPWSKQLGHQGKNSIYVCIDIITFNKNEIYQNLRTTKHLSFLAY